MRVFCAWLILIFALEKIFCDAVETYQNPQDLDDKGGKIKAVKKRKSNQPGTQTVQNGINQGFAFYSFGLEQNVGENNDSDAG